MLKYIKRLFGIKPTEVKVEVAPVQEVIPEATPEPARINVDTAGNVGIGTVNVVEPVVESTPPVVETTTEEVAPVVPEKTKKPAAKKPRAKKSTK